VFKQAWIQVTYSVILKEQISQSFDPSERLVMKRRNVIVVQIHASQFLERVKNLWIDGFYNIIVDGDNREIQQALKVCFLKNGDAVVGGVEVLGVFVDITWYRCERGVPACGCFGSARTCIGAWGQRSDPDDEEDGSDQNLRPPLDHIS
jgi:hypothetical protein